MPSLKLIMFTIATNQSTVSGYCAGPEVGDAHERAA